MASDDASALTGTFTGIKFGELRDLAAALLRRERRDHTLERVMARMWLRDRLSECPS